MMLLMLNDSTFSFQVDSRTEWKEKGRRRRRQRRRRKSVKKNDHFAYFNLLNICHLPLSSLDSSLTIAEAERFGGFFR